MVRNRSNSHPLPASRAGRVSPSFPEVTSASSPRVRAEKLIAAAQETPIHQSFAFARRCVEAAVVALVDESDSGLAYAVRELLEAVQAVFDYNPWERPDLKHFVDELKSLATKVREASHPTSARTKKRGEVVRILLRRADAFMKGGVVEAAGSEEGQLTTRQRAAAFLYWMVAETLPDVLPSSIQFRSPTKRVSQGKQRSAEEIQRRGSRDELLKSVEGTWQGAGGSRAIQSVEQLLERVLTVGYKLPRDAARAVVKTATKKS